MDKNIEFCILFSFNLFIILINQENKGYEIENRLIWLCTHDDKKPWGKRDNEIKDRRGEKARN